MKRIALVLLFFCLPASAQQLASELLSGDIDDIVFDARTGAIRAFERDDWKLGVRLARVPLEELSLPPDLGEKIAYNFVRESLGAVQAGCWVNAYAGTQYRPPMTTFTGPSHERISLAPMGSLVVGPGARLVGYAAPRFERRTVVLGPEATIPDLDRAGFERRTDAFKIICEGARG